MQRIDVVMIIIYDRTKLSGYHCKFRSTTNNKYLLYLLCISEGNSSQMPEESKAKNHSSSRGRRTTSLDFIFKRLSQMRIVKSFSVVAFVVLTLMCFLVTIVESELKVARHTFEDGLDDWKVENQTWLRLPFSRLKKEHPSLPKPSQLNSTVSYFFLSNVF